MKNKKLLIGMTVAVVLIALSIYLIYRRAKKIGTQDLTGLNSDASGSNENSSGTGSGKTESSFMDKVTGTVGSWWDWISGTTSKAMSEVVNAASFPLQYGARGTEVKNLQIWLNDHVVIPYAPLDVDGVWGPKTDAAVKRTLNVTEITLAWYQKNILKQSI
jgi:hypothetical protein